MAAGNQGAEDAVVCSGETQRKPLTVASALPQVADLPALSLPAAAAAAAGLAAAVSLSDPERRRKAEAVRAHFNSIGFERWRKIYGSTTDIHEGHAQTVAATLAMLRDAPDVPLAGATVCDAVCGTGSLSILLVSAGASVLASDISAAMVLEAQRQAQLAQAAGSPDFRMPLESLDGSASGCSKQRRGGREQAAMDFYLGKMIPRG